MKEDKFNLKILQEESLEWTNRNFPVSKPHRPLLGVIEEVGELSHAHLKMEQGIRENEGHFEKKVDAIGDIVIFLADYCNRNDIDFQDAVFNTWQDVKKRDWIKFPINGIDK